MRDEVDLPRRIDANLVHVIRIVQIDELWQHPVVLVEHRKLDVDFRGCFRIEGDRTALVRPRWSDWEATVNAIADNVVGI